MVLNTRDYNLARDAADLLRRLASASCRGGEVKPEITESMIEINSRRCTRATTALLAELRGDARRARRRGAAH